MKATCPKNKNHHQFVTVAHVTQDWVVDEHGDFIEVLQGQEAVETTHGPDAGNCWSCYHCGAEAKVED